MRYYSFYLIFDMDLLTVEHVSKRYTNHLALDDVSLSVPAGCVYGLLGPNGAGKTTLIRIINRITAPDSGRVFFDGREMVPQDILNIGYLPEERGLYRKMKVGEQAIYFARLKGLSRHDAIVRLKEWFVKFGIEQWWNKRVEELSKGMAQKVQFIITVLHEPKLLIFDEPFSGFDPINANLLKGEMMELRDRGATIIFSTHNMSSVEEVCDRITLINKSKNILTGRLDEVRHSHGNNIFQVDFRGDEVAVRDMLASCFSVIDSDLLPSIYNSVKFQIGSDDDLRGVIRRLNEMAEVRSLREVIPTMNDIFINAVEGASARDAAEQKQ